MSVSWKEFRSELDISQEEELSIALEKELIKAFVKVREEKGLTQGELAELCHVKQPMVGRLEACMHSPRVSSLLKLLVPLGYKLQIVPMNDKERH